jgi:hypothetical protein
LALLGLAVRLVLAAIGAEFLHFETLGGRLLVLGARVVPVFAFLTLECDDFSRHCFLTSDSLQPALNPTARNAAFALCVH